VIEAAYRRIRRSQRVDRPERLGCAAPEALIALAWQVPPESEEPYGERQIAWTAPRPLRSAVRAWVTPRPILK
jgi:hypothetical protein